MIGWVCDVRMFLPKKNYIKRKEEKTLCVTPLSALQNWLANKKEREVETTMIIFFEIQ